MWDIKIVFVGDPYVGKTSLIRRYNVNNFDENYCPTVYDMYETFHRFDDGGYNLRIEDTSGQSDYARLRPLQYHDADMFVICFAIADPAKEVSPKNPKNFEDKDQKRPPIIAENSFLNVSSCWYPEVCHYKPNRAKIVLLGNKSDLRDGPGSKPEFAVTSKQGKKLAKSLKIDYYFECSSKTGQNIEGLFDRIIEIHLGKDKVVKQKRKRCEIL